MAIFSTILTFNFTAEDYTEATEHAKRIGDLVLSENLAMAADVLDVELLDLADEDLDTDEEDE